ncbi:MAG: hypothetical protein LLF93_09420 [Bacteroidales bacterium]|nr:hypothetical protein [Bacteroidales bacterium]
MTNEEIATVVAEAVTKAMQPYVEKINSLQPQEQPDDGLSPGMRKYLKDKDENRLAGKDF